MAAAQEDLTVITGGPPCWASRLHGRSGRGEAAQTGRLGRPRVHEAGRHRHYVDARGARAALGVQYAPMARSATCATSSTASTAL